MGMEFFNKLKSRLSAVKAKAEQGMTMVEVIMAVVIIGILATIAYPSWAAIKNQIHENNVKTAISQAALLLEQESIDNNGLVPKYVPNEILDDEVMSKFSYSHKDRLKWCITAKIDKNSLVPWGSNTRSIWYSSSENKEPSREGCGSGYELLEGSAVPWQVPTVTIPEIKTYQTTWNIAEENAKALTSVTESQCVLSAEDVDVWNSQTSVSYALKVTNLHPDRKEQVFISEWVTDPNQVNIAALTGAWPDDNIRFEVRARCTLTAGVPYQYYSDWSTPVESQVARYTIPTPNFAANSPKVDIKRGGPEVASSVNASWDAPATCPAPAVRKYYLRASANSKAITLQTGTPPISNGNLTTNLIPGYTHSYQLQMACQYPSSGPNLTSGIRGASEETKLRPPIVKTDITAGFDETINASNNPKFTPNHITWDDSAVQCTYGTLMHDIEGTYRYPDLPVALPMNPETVTGNMFSLAGKDYQIGDTLNITVKSYCSGIINSQMKKSDYALETKNIEVTLAGLKPGKPTTTTFSNISVVKSSASQFPKSIIKLSYVTCPTGSTLEAELFKNKHSRAEPGERKSLGMMSKSNWTGNTFHLSANIPDEELAFLAYQTYEIEAWCENYGTQSDKISRSIEFMNEYASLTVTNPWAMSLKDDLDQSITWNKNAGACPTTQGYVDISMTTLNGTSVTNPASTRVPMEAGKGTALQVRTTPGQTQRITANWSCQGIDETQDMWNHSRNYTKPALRAYPGTLAAAQSGTAYLYQPNSIGTTGSFAARSTIPTSVVSNWSSMSDWIIADYNGDGVLDIIVAWDTGKGTNLEGTLNYYPGIKEGGFGTAIRLGGTGWNKFNITMANNWGKDSSVANPDPSKPTIIAKTPSGGIQSYTYNPTGVSKAYTLPSGSPNLTAASNTIYTADINGDGIPDVVTRNNTTISAFTHTVFTLPPPFSSTESHGLGNVSNQTFAPVSTTNTTMVKQADGFASIDRNNVNFSGFYAIDTSVSGNTGRLMYYTSNANTGKYSGSTVAGSSGWGSYYISGTGWGWEPFPGYNP